MTEPNSRPEWDEYFLKIASVVAERSTCLRHHIGAIAVRNRQILSTGYNGAAAGLQDCTVLGCLRDAQGIPSGTRHEVCRAIHAEQNAIIQAARHGVGIEGATMYCTHTPCILCAKMMVNARIARSVSFGKYSDDEFIKLFEEAGIEVAILPRPTNIINFLD